MTLKMKDKESVHFSKDEIVTRSLERLYEIMSEPDRVRFLKMSAEMQKKYIMDMLAGSTGNAAGKAPRAMPGQGKE
ncbi:MAG: hypothetical protein LLG37_09260 [Spirochaetia bacterium]|nr:hypothetical protein [Spirochaetia bacterium]